jgi:hypothetical protein
MYLNLIIRTPLPMKPQQTPFYTIPCKHQVLFAAVLKGLQQTSLKSVSNAIRMIELGENLEIL